MNKKDYYEVDGINYSSLSKLSNNILPFDKSISPTEAMIFGSVVDALITGDKKVINGKPLPSIETKGGEIINEFINTIKTDKSILSFQTEEEYFISLCKKYDFYKTDSAQLKLYENNKETINKILDGKDDMLFVEDFIYNEALYIVNMIKTHKYTSHLFDITSKDITDIYQLEIYFPVDKSIIKVETEKNYIYKCKLDKIIVDTEKRIVYPYDIKVKQKDILNFPSGFDFFRYDIQAALYTNALKTIFPNFIIDKFRFIVASRTENYPLIYEVSNIMYKRGKYGDDKYKGYLELTSDYIWHLENKIMEVPRKIELNNGLLII